MFFFLFVNILANLQYLDDETFVVGKLNYRIKEGSNNIVEIAKTQCPTEATTLEIPATIVYNGKTYTVDSIEEEAFKGCQNYIGDLIVPQEITFIGYRAFADCGFTGSLTFNAQCEIDSSLFSNTNKWKGSLTIGDKVPSIGDRAFEDNFVNTENAQLTIGTGVKSIGSMAFYRCRFSAEETIVIPQNVEKVGGQFLSQFKGAKNLDLQATLEQLTQNDMLGLESFETLTISNTKTFCEKCLYGYTNFKTISIKNAVNFMSYAFSHASFDQDLVISEKVEQIGFGCFSYSKWTGSLTINANIFEIDPSMFSHATFGGSKLVINNVQSIGARAFENCFTSEISIEFKKIKSIGSMAFYNCRIGNLTIPSTVELIGRAAFNGAIGDKLTIDLPSFSYTNSTWFEGKNQIKSLVLGSNFIIISDSTFANNKNYPEGLTLKGKITKIGDKAFYNCSGFSGSLTIPETVNYIGENSFSFCSGFTEDLTINANISTIDQTMFSEMSGFKGSLIIGPYIKTIDIRAFEYISCFKKDLIIGKSVTTIGFNAFYNTGFNTLLTIPENVKKIKAQAFMGSSFTGLYIVPINIELNKNSFAEMNSLSTVTFHGQDEIKINSTVFGDSIESFIVVVPSTKAVKIMDQKVQQINVVGDATIDLQTQNSMTIQPDTSNANKKSELTIDDIKSTELTIKSFNEVSVNLNSNSPIVFDETASITVNASKPITINEVKCHTQKNKVDFKSSGSEVLIKKILFDGNQSKSFNFVGNSNIDVVDFDSGSIGILSNVIVSGKINLKVNSNLEIDQCDIKPSSIINLYYKNFQSKTRLKILSSKNLSALSESFEPGQLNITFEDVNSIGEVVVIEGIDKENCLNELDNITLPSSNFITVCDNNNLIVKFEAKKEKDKSNLTLYIIIGVVGVVALALIILLVVLVIKKKDQLKKKRDSEFSKRETQSLRSTLL